jgi:hypothetical protein
MRRILSYGGPLLATCLALTGLSSAYADTTTVTTKTTTVDSSAPFALPSSTYVVVDPLTGTIRGDYVMGTRVFDGMPLSSNYVVMDKVSRRLVGTFDANGNLVDISAAPAATSVVVSVDSHRTALEREIANLLASGKITVAQADTMRLDIARLFPGASQTTTTRTVTYSSALAADSGLYTVESSLVPFTKKTYTSTVVTPRFLSVDGQIILPDSLTSRRLQLTRQIDDQFALGHLTRNQMLSLKTDMTDISDRDARYRVGGLMSDAHATSLATDLNAVQSRLDRNVASVNTGHPL